MGPPRLNLGKKKGKIGKIDREKKVFVFSKGIQSWPNEQKKELWREKTSHTEEEDWDLVENLADIFSVAFDQLSIKFPSFKNLLFFLFSFQKSARLKNRREKNSARKFFCFPFPNPCVFQTQEKKGKTAEWKKSQEIPRKGVWKRRGEITCGTICNSAQKFLWGGQRGPFCFFSGEKNWEKLKENLKKLLEKFGR